MTWPQCIGTAFFATMLAGPLISSHPVIGQTDEEPNATEKKSDEKSMSQRIASKRLEFMKTSVSKYEIAFAEDETAKLSLLPEPLLRFTNPVSGLQRRVNGDTAYYSRFVATLMPPVWPSCFTCV